MAEQRCKAILAVIADGRTVSEVASDCGVCRRTMHRWLAHYEAEGLEGLSDRSHRPVYCPRQMPATVTSIGTMSTSMLAALSVAGSAPTML